MMPPGERSRVTELRRLLDAGSIRSVYQPIVALPEGTVVGYEALARGPEGSPLQTPGALFSAAAEGGLLLELEWACRAAAFRGAREHLPAGATLFVNVEPGSLAAAEPAGLATLADAAVDHGPVVLELTERALAETPSKTLEAVPALRRRGFQIAVDDVGVEAASIGLLPFLQPEVIKLDLRLVGTDEPVQDVASVVHAVAAAAERAEAAVVAEGIETEAQEHLAQSLGARHGQGWRFGRPAALPPPGPPTGQLRVAARQRLADDAHHLTPYALVRERLEPRVGTKGVLVSIAKYLEHHIAQPAFASVLLATFEREQHFTPRTRARYERLSRSAAFVGVFASGLEREPLPNVRGVDLSPDEPLIDEWDVAVVTPHIAAAFVARDLGDEDRPDAERRFAYCLTYDRDLAVRTARMLMARLNLDS